MLFAIVKLADLKLGILFSFLSVLYDSQYSDTLERKKAVYFHLMVLDSSVMNMLG